MKRIKDIHYTRVKSFSDLHNEKIRLMYEVRLARRKLDLSVLELSASLNPMRLLSGFVGEWIRPLQESLFEYIKRFFSGHFKKEA